MNKQLSTFLLILFLAVLSACETTPPTPEVTIDDAYLALTIEDISPGVSLPDTIEGFAISWSANLQNVLDGTTILPQDTDTSVTLIASISSEDKVLNKIFYITILGEEIDPNILLDAVYDELTLPDELDGMVLPTIVNDLPITWSSTVESVLEGSTVIPATTDTDIVLTATFELDGITRTKTFTVTVLGDPSGVLSTLQNASVTLLELLATGTEQGITSDLDFPPMYGDIQVTYLSDNTMYIADDGTVHRPSASEGDEDVTITITFELDGVTYSDELSFLVLATNPVTVYDGYYEGANGLIEDALRLFLHNLIDDHIVYSYASLWEHLAYTDEDPNNPNNVILLYSGTSMDEDNHGGDSDEWNREHTWPRSHGDLDSTGNPAYTDMHHLRPTKVPVNSARGNLDFDEGGTLVALTTGSYKDGDSFEPRDEVKGDVARMMFYMAIRYEGDVSGEVDLEINDLVNNSGPYIGRLSILIQWHLQDPPDEFEMTRNDRIYELQGNRNPFIDHPEFVEYIWNTD